MVKRTLWARRWRRRSRRLVQSTRGKLALVFSVMLLIFGGASALERWVTPHHLWRFTCHAQGYLSHAQSHAAPSDVMLLLEIDHQQASLHYQLDSNAALLEFAIFQGEVAHVDLGSLSYQLALVTKALQWQENSSLHPYLINELSLNEIGLQLLARLPIQVQILNVDSGHSRATLKFMPSNNLWSCQVVSADLHH